MTESDGKAKTELPIKVVAEIGCNHMGSMKIAKELVELAADAGCDYAKFQKRNNKELLTAEEYERPHPNPRNSFGPTYGKHREFLEFSKEQHIELAEFCLEVGIGYSTSVWDVSSARDIIAINPEFIKVPSACNLNFDMLQLLRDHYHGEIQVSVGMTSLREIDSIVSFFSEIEGMDDRLILYACTSGYPVPVDDICLLELTRLQHLYTGTVKAFGFSGHHTGHVVDVAAYALGASWIERHFTKDKSWKGTDHAASLDTVELRDLCSNLSLVKRSMAYKSSDILPIELEQREKLKRL